MTPPPSDLRDLPIIIIEVDGVKRRVPAHFSVCSDPETLDNLIEALQNVLDDMRAKGATYGWSKVCLHQSTRAPSTDIKSWGE